MWTGYLLLNGLKGLSVLILLKALHGQDAGGHDGRGVVFDMIV